MSWWPPPGWELGDTKRAAVEHVIEAGFRMVGRGPGDHVYRDACWPGEPLATQRAYERKHSACALLAACWLRCAGMEDAPDTPQAFRLAPPYVSGMAMARLVHHAMRHCVLCEPDGDAEPGDVVIVGEDTDRKNGFRTWGGPGHALLVVDVDPVGWESIDGGRGKVARVTRVVVDQRGHRWLRDRWFTRRIQHRIRIRSMVMTGVFVLPPLRPTL